MRLQREKRGIVGDYMDVRCNFHHADNKNARGSGVQPYDQEQPDYDLYGRDYVPAEFI